MYRKAIILGIKGTKLTNDEKLILKHGKPWGIILFSRNISNLTQLSSLIKDIKFIIKDKNYPIIIDEEGGKVSRLKKIIDLSLFSQNYFANIYKKDKKNFYHIYKIYIDTVSNIFNKVGININTVPVLDIYRSSSHSIIGNRSFSNDPKIVTEMGNHCIALFRKNKIATVMKHIPGHGMAKSDSHYKTSIITSNKKDLINKDFKPFKNCRTFFAMTAHLIYKSFDEKYTATHSSIIINEVIRNTIGFKGILISDDISMKALKFSLKENAIKALDSGCNLVLHCNGNTGEMRKLLKIVPTIDKFTQKKTSHFYNFLG